MIHPIEPISILSIIQGMKPNEKEQPVKEETIQKINDLGLGSLLKVASGEEFRTLLEQRMWETAGNVKKRMINYSTKDYENALQFLEIFCLYSAQSNVITHKKDCTFVMESGPNSRLTTWYDKSVSKCIQTLEELSSLLKSRKGVGKETLQPHLKRLNTLLDKVFTEDLSQTEQKAVAKKLEQAKKILSTLA